MSEKINLITDIAEMLTWIVDCILNIVSVIGQYFLPLARMYQCLKGMVTMQKLMIRKNDKMKKQKRREKKTKMLLCLFLIKNVCTKSDKLSFVGNFVHKRTSKKETSITVAVVAVVVVAVVVVVVEMPE